MSSFQPPGRLTPDGESIVHTARGSEATTFPLSLPPLRSLDPLQHFVPHAAQGPRLTAQLPSASLPPIAQCCPQLPNISHQPSMTQRPSMSPGYPFGTYLDPETSGAQTNLLPPPNLLPIAPSESHRIMSGGRHKKEVKRRTKTGCLTCRKRRIKVSHILLGGLCWG